jgi:cation transport regulator
MPYERIGDLPAAQVSQYSGHQREVFRAAFNSAHAEGKSEASCFAIAHSAAKRAGGIRFRPKKKGA